MAENTTAYAKKVSSVKRAAKGQHVLYRSSTISRPSRAVGETRTGADARFRGKFPAASISTLFCRLSAEPTILLLLSWSCCCCRSRQLKKDEIAVGPATTSASRFDASTTKSDFLPREEFDSESCSAPWTECADNGCKSVILEESGFRNSSAQSPASKKKVHRKKER